MSDDPIRYSSQQCSCRLLSRVRLVLIIAMTANPFACSENLHKTTDGLRQSVCHRNAPCARVSEANLYFPTAGLTLNLDTGRTSERTVTGDNAAGRGLSFVSVGQPDEPSCGKGKIVCWKPRKPEYFLARRFWFRVCPCSLRSSASWRA